MKKVVETDILIIGAGPIGLFTVFEAGLLGLKCQIVDNLNKIVKKVYINILLKVFCKFDFKLVRICRETIVSAGPCSNIT